jgi:D-arginine dehydrogenase
MTEKVRSADIIVIGAGMAGASIAGFLAGRARVEVLEMEDRPGYHATGRSAANYEPSFGPAGIRALTLASGAFLRDPPDGFCEAALLSPRGAIMLCYPGDEGLMADALAGGYRMSDAREACARIPLLKPEGTIGVLADDSIFDLDVDALHQGFLRQHKRGGGGVVTRAEVTAARSDGGAWRLETNAGAFSAPIVVNAAGAWADRVATLFGARPVGLVPKRRSAAIIPAPVADIMSWPQLSPAREPFYCKPTGGKLMISPADAEPSEPHDAWADDMALAEAIDAFQQVVDTEVTRIEHSWGGLRTFAPDGEPVVGFDAHVPGLFWLAGQGGYGIQTAPALGALAASLVMRDPAPVIPPGLAPASIAPERFA